MLGSQDLLIGLVLALFLFGSKKLPELAGSLGKSMKEFKKATEGDANAPAMATVEPAAPAPAAPALPARPCGACQTSLTGDWTHCPKCGAPVAPPSMPPTVEAASVSPGPRL